jgi:4-hydroxy-tetrahydrodipicolinate synthase
MWSGNDDQVVPMMSLGAKGVISVVSNVWPQVMAQMTQLCLEGKFAEAAKLQLSITPLCDALFCEVNPIPVKGALNLMGMNAGELRLPLCDMSDAHMEQMKNVLTQFGLLK